MAFLIGSSTGGTFLASTLSVRESVYDPVYDTELPTSTIWNLLPSTYKFLEDRDVIESMWTGVVQVLSADLLNLWQIDYAKSLRDVPVLSQRKWVKYDFLVEEDFLADPSLTLLGLPNTFTYASGIVAAWTNRGGLDKAGTALRGSLTEEASLSWSFEATWTSVQTCGCSLVGYLASTPKNALRDALVVGVFGDEDTADTPFPFLLHISPVGSFTYAMSGVSLTVGTRYRFDASYTARTGDFVLAVSDLDALKVTGSTGVTEDSSDLYTNTFTDESQDFDTLGIVAGDVIVLEGVTYTISTVSGSILVTEFVNLPASASALSYTIRGKDVVATVAVNLPNAASDASFTVDQFGTCSLDIRLAPSGLASQAALGRRTTGGTIHLWSYLDPTVAESLVRCPRLQDTIVSPAVLLYEGTDYSITRSTFLFQEPPTQSYWAEYASYDERFVQDNFGVSVGLDEDASDAYKAKVQGLFYAYYRGPTISAIRTGVHILVGLPIAAVAGTVESINPDYSGVYGQIVVAGTGYLYPLAAGTSLEVNDVVTQFQPLSDGVDVLDYVNSPRWWTAIGSPDGAGTLKEALKIHAFAVELNLDAFDLDTLSKAAEFVQEIKPTWKDPYFIVYKVLTDDIDISDDITLAVTLKLWDVLTDGLPIPRYDSIDYEGDAADWRYDMTLDVPTDIDEDSVSALMRGRSSRLTGYVTLSLDPVIGSYSLTGTSTLWTTEINSTFLTGTVTDTGVAGSSDVTGTLFTGDVAEAFLTSIPHTDDPDLLPKYVTHLRVPSVGIVRVTRVIDDQNLEVVPVLLSGSFVSLVGVSYTVAYSMTAITFGRYFFGTTGTTTSGSQLLTQAGAFSSAEAGSVILIAGELDVFGDPKEFKVQEVTSDDALLLDQDVSTTHAGNASWQLYAKATYWNVVVRVVSDTSIVIAEAPVSDALSGSVNYWLASFGIEDTRPIYDQFDEVKPEEDLEVVQVLSAGFNETLLSGKLTFSASSVTVNGAGTLFTTEIAGVGVCSILIIDATGQLHRVVAVVSDTQITLSANPAASAAAVTAFRSHAEVPGTIAFVNGSLTANTSADFRAFVSVDDWLHAAPCASTTLPARVAGITAATITWSTAYAGPTTTRAAAIRGPNSLFPYAVGTPSGSQNFTAWFGMTGDEVSSTIAERMVYG